MTPRQLQLLNILRRDEILGVATPSYAQIAREMNLASKSGVKEMLRLLERDGFVVRTPRRPRSLRVVKPIIQRIKDVAAFFDGHPEKVSADAAISVLLKILERDREA